MYNNYLPIEVKKGNKIDIWYMDVSKLGLSDLIKLRKELTKTNGYAVRKIDSIIYHEIGHVNAVINTKKEGKKKEKTLIMTKRKLSKRSHKRKK